MRSFAVIAGFAAAANAAAVYGYPAESSSVAYAAESSTAAEYPAYPAESSSAPAYETSSAAEYSAYPVESSAAYAASSAYEAYSSAPAYTTTEVVTGYTTVCPEATTITYGSQTYSVGKSSTLEIPEYTTTYEVKPTPSAVKTPVHSEYSPPKYTSSVAVPLVSSAPYPVYSAPSNGTVPAGTAAPTAGKPSATTSSTPEFTGAAGKATVGFFAIAGAVAAFL